MSTYKKRFINQLTYMLLCLLLLSGCKKPKAGFSLNKSEYSAGDQIEPTNTSKHSDKYVWSITDPNGVVLWTSTAHTPYAPMSVKAIDGQYILRLETSLKGKRTSDYSQTFSIKSVRTNVRVSSYQNCSVVVNREDFGIIQINYQTYVDIMVPIGRREIGVRAWNGYNTRVIDVEEGKTYVLNF